MDISVFEDNEKLLAILRRVDSDLANKAYSDVIDDEGHQYIDLVMEGGGMLGIAHIGYIYVLERAGIRFLSIGGASAGSINALLLAAIDTPDKAKGRKLLLALANKNFFDFVDGGRISRSFISAMLAEPKQKYIILLTIIPVILRLFKKWGLNCGVSFKNWIKEELEKAGIQNTATLKARIETVPQGLRVINRNPNTTKKDKYITSQDDICARLAIITADVSTESKIEFPRMAHLYWDNIEDVNPSEYVRTSMSIPYFFKPYTVKHRPVGPTTKTDWYTATGYKCDEEKGLPKEAIFIDGGVMSNFPIDVFHTPEKTPSRPTFGVKLELDHRRKHIDSTLALTGAIFNSARHTLDYDFISKNPDYQLLVKHIPAKGYNWLDFNISDENKLGLLLDGAKCAEEFLRGFDWEKYKILRRTYARQFKLGEELRIKAKKAIEKTRELS